MDYLAQVWHLFSPSSPQRLIFRNSSIYANCLCCFTLGSAPAIQLTPEEKVVYGQLFYQADPDLKKTVTGEVASQLFIKSGLSKVILGEIWQMADPENKGFLDQQGFSIALRVIGHVQNGQRLAPNLGEIRMSTILHFIPGYFHILFLTCFSWTYTEI